MDRIGVHPIRIAVRVARIILNALIFDAISIPFMPGSDICQTREFQ